MVVVDLSPGSHTIRWDLPGYSQLVAVINVGTTGIVTCTSVTGGSCASSSPPGVTISGNTVYGYLFASAVTPTPVVTPTPTPSGAAISNIVALTGTVYTQDDLALGKNVYVNRTYTFSSTQMPFTGLKYILTDGDERYYTDTGFLKFNVNQPSTVYVAYDDRITVKPSWLTSAFTDTTLNMVRSDGVTFSIFEKSYPAGQVSLGGCSIPTGGAGGMYSVFIKLSGITPTPTPSAGYSSWVTSKGGPAGIKGNLLSVGQIIDGYIDLGSLGFTVSLLNVGTTIDYYLGG